jgi:hypothetical protein
VQTQYQSLSLARRVGALKPGHKEFRRETKRQMRGMKAWLQELTELKEVDEAEPEMAKGSESSGWGTELQGLSAR